MGFLRFACWLLLGCWETPIWKACTDSDTTRVVTAHNRTWTTRTSILHLHVFVYLYIILIYVTDYVCIPTIMRRLNTVRSSVVKQQKMAAPEHVGTQRYRGTVASAALYAYPMVSVAAHSTCVMDRSTMDDTDAPLKRRQCAYSITSITCSLCPSRGVKLYQI